MIAFRKRTLWESLLYFLPSHRRKRQAELKEAIRWLVEHPEAPCLVEGALIPNGFGDPRWVPELGHPLKPRKEK